MIVSASRLVTRYVPVAVARRVKEPGGALAGRRTVNVTLRDSSSWVNARVSDGGGAQPGGTASRTEAVALPRDRFVTETITVRSAVVVPPAGQTMRPGVTATSKFPVTNSGRRISPFA